MAEGKDTMFKPDLELPKPGLTKGAISLVGCGHTQREMGDGRRERHGSTR